LPTKGRGIVMAQAIRAKDLSEAIEQKAQITEARSEAKARKGGRLVMKGAKAAFKNKTFSALTDEEKDTILRALAISAGIIED